MANRLTRRRFLQHSAVAGGAAAASGAWALPGWAQTRSPGSKLNIAVVGVSGRGGANLGGVSSENIVALCDIDEKKLDAAGAKFLRAQKFFDFRQMLDKVEKQIDAVVVSTPDHAHAAPAAMALKMGKHCYCEKPLTHTVSEARTVAQLAKQKNRVTQLGTQIHAGTNYRRVVELVQSGAIGPVREVHVWSAASYGKDKDGNYLKRPTETPPVPKELHWDLWIGPAPMRPYHPCYLPGKWRGWWDFGTGGMGDFGCHYMDLPFWALKLRHPTSVEAEGPPIDVEATAPWMIVRYEYPARGDLPPVKLTWYDGGKRPERLKNDKAPEWKSGVLFVGEKGLLLADYGRKLLLPESQFAGFKPPEPTIPDSIGHHQEWILACKTGGATTCNFDYSGALTEAVLLGVVSYRAGSKLDWDAVSLKATNCAPADRLIQHSYRQGWSL